MWHKSGPSNCGPSDTNEDVRLPCQEPLCGRVQCLQLNHAYGEAGATRLPPGKDPLDCLIEVSNPPTSFLLALHNQHVQAALGCARRLWLPQQTRRQSAGAPMY